MYHHVSPCITICITIVFNLAAPLLEYSAGFAVMRTTSLDTGDSKTSTWENNTRYWVKAGPLLSVFSYLIHSESVIHSVARKDTNGRLDCLCALRVFEDLLSILGITLHLAVLFTFSPWSSRQCKNEGLLWFWDWTLNSDIPVKAKGGIVLHMYIFRFELAFVERCVAKSQFGDV